MAWKYKDVDINSIQFARVRKSHYQELYDKIGGLKIGQAFEIETDIPMEAANIRKAVSAFLHRKGLADKYICGNRLNKFYCGRTK